MGAGSPRRGHASITAAVRVVALALALSVSPLSAYGDGVELRVHQGVLSARFDAVPAREALDAIHRATGMELVVPPSAQARTLTLSVDEVSLELFLRRVLAGLGLEGFVFVYEPAGRTGRLTVLDWAPGPTPPASPSRAVADAHEDEAEAVYIPPRNPPVHIQSVAPPVYVPPATAPQYVPPRR